LSAFDEITDEALLLVWGTGVKDRVERTPIQAEGEGRRGADRRQTFGTADYELIIETGAPQCDREILIDDLGGIGRIMNRVWEAIFPVKSGVLGRDDLVGEGATSI